MPIKLDNIPPPLPAPSAPSVLRWLLLLVIVMLLGMALTLWIEHDALEHRPSRFWQIALGTPFLVWIGLGCLRALLQIFKWGYVDAWNDEREAVLIKSTRMGLRSQQVLAVSLHTALREPGAENGDAQREALLRGAKALRVQPGWQNSEDGVRHSRLPNDPAESPEALLRRTLKHALTDIAQALTALPEDQPLALLLENATSTPEFEINELWQAVWLEAGIRQNTTPFTGSGLSAMECWLDERIQDRALLLVVAFQLAPTDTEETAEAVVALLFGNRLTQTLLAPMAYLHRPEQVRETTTNDLRRAAQQALDWVPVEASSIHHVWMAGTDFADIPAITSLLGEVSMPVDQQQGVHDLSASLGNPGCAAPWVAIAAAVESIRAQGQPHCVFCGGSSTDGRLWCSVVMPPAMG